MSSTTCSVTNKKANLAAKILFGLGALFSFTAAFLTYLLGLAVARSTPPTQLPLRVGVDVAVDETLTVDENKKGGRL